MCLEHTTSFSTSLGANEQIGYSLTEYTANDIYDRYILIPDGETKSHAKQYKDKLDQKHKINQDKILIKQIKESEKRQKLAEKKAAADEKSARSREAAATSNNDNNSNNNKKRNTTNTVNDDLSIITLNKRPKLTNNTKLNNVYNNILTHLTTNTQVISLISTQRLIKPKTAVYFLYDVLKSEAEKTDAEETRNPKKELLDLFISEMDWYKVCIMYNIMYACIHMCMCIHIMYVCVYFYSSIYAHILAL